jgi:rod shape-determining protein MreC
MRRINKVYAGTAAVIGLLIFLNWFNLISPLEEVTSRIFSPFFGFLNSWSVAINSTYNKQTNKENLWIELNSAKEELNKLRSENASLKIVEDENRALRELLQFTEEKKYSYIVSRVISRGSISDVSGRTESIIINRGRKNGVVLGAAVVDSNGVLIGKVSSLKDVSAQVDILNSSRCKVAASILDFTGTSGVVTGELGLSVVMNTIPQDLVLNLGNTAITSGLEEMIPRGLVIGKIISINKENNELWQTAQIEPFFSLSDLLIVAVIKP